MNRIIKGEWPAQFDSVVAIFRLYWPFRDTNARFRDWMRLHAPQHISTDDLDSLVPSSSSSSSSSCKAWLRYKRLDAFCCCWRRVLFYVAAQIKHEYRKKFGFAFEPAWLCGYLRGGCGGWLPRCEDETKLSNLRLCHVAPNQKTL